MGENTYTDPVRQEKVGALPKCNIRVSVLNNDGWLPVVDDDEVLVLGGEDCPALCTVAEAMTFLRQAAERPSWPLTSDPTNGALWAFEAAIEAYKVIGREGLAGVCEYMQFFETKMRKVDEENFVDLEAPGKTSFDPYLEPGLLEALIEGSPRNG
jgi:hypothetical protein